MHPRKLSDLSTSLSIGDVWSLSFTNGLVLLAQELVAPEEHEIAGLLRAASAPLLAGVDPENIPKCVAALRNVRRDVMSVALDAKAQLQLKFEGGGELLATTTTDVVDWQWCVNASGRDPYVELGVACFDAGDVQFDPGFGHER